MGHQLKLMDRARISRCIKRMAIQVYEHFSVNLPLHVIGLNERGFALAKELSIRSLVKEIASYLKPSDTPVSMTFKKQCN